MRELGCVGGGTGFVAGQVTVLAGLVVAGRSPGGARHTGVQLVVSGSDDGTKTKTMLFPPPATPPLFCELAGNSPFFQPEGTLYTHTLRNKNAWREATHRMAQSAPLRLLRSTCVGKTNVTQEVTDVVDGQMRFHLPGSFCCLTAAISRFSQRKHWEGKRALLPSFSWRSLGEVWGLLL